MKRSFTLSRWTLCSSVEGAIFRFQPLTDLLACVTVQAHTRVRRTKGNHATLRKTPPVPRIHIGEVGEGAGLVSHLLDITKVVGVTKVAPPGRERIAEDLGLLPAPARGKLYHVGAGTSILLSNSVGRR